MESPRRSMEVWPWERMQCHESGGHIRLIMNRKVDRQLRGRLRLDTAGRETSSTTSASKPVNIPRTPLVWNMVVGGMCGVCVVFVF